MLHIALPERPVVTTNQKNHPPWYKSISAYHNQLHPNLNKKRRKSFRLWHNCVEILLVATINQNFFESHFIQFQPTFQQYGFLNIQRKNPVVCRLRIRFCYSDCERSVPWNDNELTRNSSVSLELVIVSKKRIFGRPFSLNLNHSQPARNTWNEKGGSLLQRSKGYGYQWLWAIKLGWYSVLLGKSPIECRCCL